MKNKLMLLFFLILFLASPRFSEGKGKEENVPDRPPTAEEMRWTIRNWCTDKNPEEKPKNKDELESRKKSVLSDFKKVHTKAEVYEVRRVKRQWEDLVHYCVFYKGPNIFKEKNWHYYQVGRPRYINKEEWDRRLGTPIEW